MPVSDKRLKQFAHVEDKDIDFSDISELDEEWFRKAILVRPDNTSEVSFDLDADVVLWFMGLGDHKARMRAVLRAYYEAKLSKTRKLADAE